MSESLRYPIGKFSPPENITRELLDHWIHRLERTPFEWEQRLEGLDERDLGLTYREGGWNIRRIYHHVADSHMNGLTRTKWALTESNPVIKPYEEKRWTELPDATSLPPGISLQILKGIHQRWVFLLRNLEEDDLRKTYIHPDTNSEISVALQAGQYAWHGDHHLAHVDIALKTR